MDEFTEQVKKMLGRINTEVFSMKELEILEDLVDNLQTACSAKVQITRLLASSNSPVGKKRES